MPKNERNFIYNKGLWKFMHTDAKKTKPNKPNFKTSRFNWRIWQKRGINSAIGLSYNNRW